MTGLFCNFINKIRASIAVFGFNFANSISQAAAECAKNTFIEFFALSLIDLFGDQRIEVARADEVDTGSLIASLATAEGPKIALRVT